jgi:hypothetical protein
MDAPFPRPWTGVDVRGKMAECVMHVPRYLIVQIRIAQENLKAIVDGELGWCEDMDWCCSTQRIMRWKVEEEKLRQELQEQDAQMAFLEEFVGLLFAALDGGLDEGLVPIWVARADVSLSSTPPTTETKLTIHTAFKDSGTGTA